MHRKTFALAVVLAAGLWTEAAVAQTTAIPPMALNRYEPAERGSEWFANESLDFRGAMRPAFGVTGDYGHAPYSLRGENGAPDSKVISHAAYVHVGGALVLAKRFRVGLTLPIAVSQGGATRAGSDRVFRAPDQGGIGDLRLSGDVRLFGEYGGVFTLALGARLWIPTGNKAQYIGDGKVRVGPRLNIAGDLGAFVYSAGLGLVYRANGSPLNGHSAGTEATFNAAIGARVADKNLVIGPEVFGSTSTGDPFAARSTPLALLVSAHYTAHSFRIGAGAGPGLSRTPGTPEFRGLLSLEYTPEIIKKEPIVSAAINLDRDSDGVLDADDACIDVPGVRTTDPKTNGCPSDRDGDGILDKDDACPTTTGVKSADAKANGCPPDADKDGVPDKAFVTKTEVKITEEIQFATNSSEILGVSQGVIDAVAKTLADHPEIKHIRVHGHTDNMGTEAYNKDLSRKRAEAVRAALIKAGVSKERLSSEGFGMEKPLGDNSTEEGRTKNRRVEFHIEDSAPNK